MNRNTFSTGSYFRILKILSNQALTQKREFCQLLFNIKAKKIYSSYIYMNTEKLFTVYFIQYFLVARSQESQPY